ncbi:MAG: rubredoxin [Ferruginibacter sp.]
MIKTIFINFPGGIIPPADLFNILLAASKIKVRYVRFGLRQQLLIDMEQYSVHLFTQELDKLEIPYEVGTCKHPNICSSYPAEDVFIRNSWLSETIYKTVLNSFDYPPELKVNICDNNQSFTPILTGNINWVATPSLENFWHLIIRFPKTNVIYEWNMLCVTSHIASVTKTIESFILQYPDKFIDNESANGDELFALFAHNDFKVTTAESPVVLPKFNLPYYEGLNRYNDKYWLGIYQRDELFRIDFLKKLCKLCISTDITEICCTAWKSILIKGIRETDKENWNLLLEAFQVNMRHAANELNFQVEDNCIEGLNLKTFLVKQLSVDDTRTFGICVGIKTRKKSEVFSSILVRRRYLVDFLGIRLFKVYDILCAKNFNPNERTGEIFSRDNPKLVLPEQLRRCIIKYYRYRASVISATTPVAIEEFNPEDIQEPQDAATNP